MKFHIYICVYIEENLGDVTCFLTIGYLFSSIYSTSILLFFSYFPHFTVPQFYYFFSYYLTICYVRLTDIALFKFLTLGLLWIDSIYRWILYKHSPRQIICICVFPTPWIAWEYGSNFTVFTKTNSPCCARLQEVSSYSPITVITFYVSSFCVFTVYMTFGENNYLILSFWLLKVKSFDLAKKKKLFLWYATTGKFKCSKIMLYNSIPFFGCCSCVFLHVCYNFNILMDCAVWWCVGRCCCKC